MYYDFYINENNWYYFFFYEIFSCLLEINDVIKINVCFIIEGVYILIWIRCYLNMFFLK